MKKRCIPMVLVALLVSAVAMAETPSVATQVDEYLHEHGGSIEVLYRALGQEPMPFRKSVYRELTAEQKSGLWRAHLAQFESLEKTPEQERALGRLIEVVTPRLFAADAEVSRRVVGEILTDIEQAFPKELVGPMVGILGAPVPQLGGPTDESCGSMPRAGEVPAVLDALVAEAPAGESLAPCTCSSSWDFCGRAWLCSDQAECLAQFSGCGLLWLWPCDGECCWTIGGLC